MPCDRIKRTPLEQREYDLALAELEGDIATGKRKVSTRNGLTSVSDWAGSRAARAGWCEGCCLRKISQKGSWVAKAKLAAGGVTQNKAFVPASHPHKH